MLTNVTSSGVQVGQLLAARRQGSPYGCRRQEGLKVEVTLKL